MRDAPWRPTGPRRDRRRPCSQAAGRPGLPVLDTWGSSPRRGGGARATTCWQRRKLFDEFQKLGVWIQLLYSRQVWSAERVGKPGPAMPPSAAGGLPWTSRALPSMNHVSVLSRACGGGGATDIARLSTRRRPRQRRRGLRPITLKRVLRPASQSFSVQPGERARLLQFGMTPGQSCPPREGCPTTKEKIKRGLRKIFELDLSKQMFFVRVGSLEYMCSAETDYFYSQPSQQTKQHSVYSRISIICVASAPPVTEGVVETSMHSILGAGIATLTRLGRAPRSRNAKGSWPA